MAQESHNLSKEVTEDAVVRTVSLAETKTDGTDGLPTLTAAEEKALIRKIDRK